MINVPRGQRPPSPMTGGAQVDIKQTTPIVCEKCKSDLFIPAFYMRKLSALVNPQGQDAVIPVQTFCCGNCGHINKEFIPLFMQTENELKSESRQDDPISKIIKP
jgi:hypothetical protein